MVSTFSSVAVFENVCKNCSFNVKVPPLCFTMHVHKIHFFPIFLFVASALSVSINSTSTTSLTISWTLDDSVTATSYTISYSNTNTDCFTGSYDDITGIAASETMYTLTGLEEGTEYSITVTAILSDGETTEDSITAITMTTGLYASQSSYHFFDCNTKR